LGKLGKEERTYCLVASPKTRIRNSFPTLSPADFKVTSPEDGNYNCVAWAANDDQRVWWPNGRYFWPAHLPLVEDVDNFVLAFTEQGFEPCESFQLEEGYEKVAIYADVNRRAKHMARQLENGAWTSKLGGSWDISHKSLSGLIGKEYGSPVRAMRRKRAI
jgi:hypothetical protein